MKNNIIVKPFLKWAGGKSQLLDKIKDYYPFEKYNIRKYAEPFVGGGAVLFDILNKFDLDGIYISDINQELINTYIVVRDHINKLIEMLTKIQNEFLNLDIDNRKKFYLKKREHFNKLKINENTNIEKASLFIFLNKTCFNGLFRVNKNGFFNVPMGNYKNPVIFDESNLRNISVKLQKVKIVCGTYKQAAEFIDKNTFIYFDPPYRPLNNTSNFTSYTKNSFNDEDQIELANFINEINKKGAKILISNSDPKNTNKDDNFFDKIYADYNINRVTASRMINCKGKARGQIKELIISN